jgi:hypothetical protein
MVAMSFFGFVVGFFFGAICHKRPSLVIDVVSAALALVPIWIVGYGLFFGDFQLAYYSALFVFLSLGVGFLILGLALGALTGYVCVPKTSSELMT